MEDEKPTSRRTFLQFAGGLGVVGAESLVLANADPDLTNGYTKALAERVRSAPGMDFPGRSRSLQSIVGGRTILAAEKDEPGYWTGAPGAVYDDDGDRVLVHVRHRKPGERGYRAALYEFDHEAWTLTELAAVEKADLAAESMEGGEIIARDGEYRWFLSYQSQRDGDWRIHERRGSTVADLDADGRDLGIDSAYFHQKDPVWLDGRLYVSSNTEGWLGQAVQRIDVDAERPTATTVPVTGASSVRPTGGRLLGDEVFTDLLPDLPGGVPNLLWTSDERSYLGSVDGKGLDVATANHLVGPEGESIKYVDGVRIGEEVLLLWQRELPNGRNDLAGTTISVATYEQLLDSLRG